MVDEVDDERLCVRQRLWRACLTRTELETAAAVLAAAGRITPMEFAERLRVHYATGFHVTTDCSRVPNLSAIVLQDLGAFDRLSSPAPPGGQVRLRGTAPRWVGRSAAVSRAFRRGESGVPRR